MWKGRDTSGIAFAAGLCCAVALGQTKAPPILLEAGLPEAQRVASVRIFGGAVEATSLPVEPSRELVAVILLDTIPREQTDPLRTSLEALYQAIQDDHPLRVAVLARENVQVAGPFRNRSQLQAALRELQRVAQTAPDQPPASSFYAALGGVAARFASGWKHLVFIGDLPLVSAELLDYGVTLLSTKCRAAKVRVSFWAPGGGASELARQVSAHTRGLIVTEGADQLAAFVKQQPGVMAELSWPQPALGRGFHLYRAQLMRGDGSAWGELPSAAVAPGADLPEMDAYAALRGHVKAARELLAEARHSPEQVEEIRRQLERALAINPRDQEALRAGADLYQRYENPKAAAELLAWLAEIEPANATLWAELGNARFLARDWVQAQESLLHARQLNPANAVVAEQVGRIRLERRDYAGALGYLEESLKLNPRNQELWFLRADAAQQAGDWRRSAESLERALELGGDHLAQRTRLIRLYLDHQAREPALRQVQAVAGNLPRDAGIRSAYAELLEELGQADQALALWRSALEAAPDAEPAHYAVTRLLLQKGDLEGALRGAAAGLEAAPQSGRLHLARAETLERKGQVQGARHALRRAAGAVQHMPLLERAAMLEDLFGDRAAEAYSVLANALEKSAPRSPEHVAALERGFRVAFRDGPAERVGWFASRLRAVEREELAAALSGGEGERRKEIWIRGGSQALAFVARCPAGSPPERFLVDYCRAIVEQTGRADQKAASAYLEALRDYFRRLTELVGTATPTGDRLRVTLSTADQKARRETERLLRLLGWRMRSSRQGVTLEPAEGLTQAQRQETMSALAIDEVGMQEALQAGKPYSFEVLYDWAAVALDEKTWREHFYARENLPGGLPEALARDPRLAKVYLGLGALDENTARALVAGVGLKPMVERYADLLYQYSGALFLDQDAVAVPGGKAAEPVWESLARASPQQPARFFRALLERDDGKLLAFFCGLWQLDSQHQRFFTRSAARTRKFYELYRDAPELRHGAERLARESPFLDFLREIPLDNEDGVRFPGSPEVWMVTRGQSGSTSQTARLIRRLAKTVAPEVEDEILLRLARTRYTGQSQQRTEVDNFLAVLRIDRQRKTPLDEASALTLAQHYSAHAAVYPYFAMLTGLGQAEFQGFFVLAEKLEGLDDVEAHLVLGQWHALVELLCLVQQAGALDEQRAAAVFRSLCERFTKAASRADYTAASLDCLRRMLTEAGAWREDVGPDEALERLLVGASGPVRFEWSGATQELDPGALRGASYRRVLELQKVTPLRALYALYDAAARIVEGKVPALEQVKILESAWPGLLTVSVPKSVKFPKKHRQSLESYRPQKVRQIINRLRQRVTRKKVNPKDLEKLRRELLAEINPQVWIALAGPVYGVFFSPNDLLVAEDPLFLRKHQFVQLLQSLGRKTTFPEAEFRGAGEKTGGFLLGGFAGFGPAVGMVALAGAKHASPAVEPLAVAQVGSLRGSDYRHLREEDLRLFGLTVRAGREWIVEAAAHTELRGALADATLGTLSLSRRRDLLAALDARDWPGVWRTVSLSDLYFLGRQCLARSLQWASPALAALKEAAAGNDGARLHALGASYPQLLNCGHPRLEPLPPYEEFERRLFPTPMAERAAEFKLYLAERLNSAGLPAETFAALAEPLAVELLREVRMADSRDWRAVLATFAKLDEQRLGTVLKKP